MRLLLLEREELLTICPYRNPLAYRHINKNVCGVLLNKDTTIITYCDALVM